MFWLKTEIRSMVIFDPVWKNMHPEGPWHPQSRCLGVNRGLKQVKARQQKRALDIQRQGGAFYMAPVIQESNNKQNCLHQTGVNHKEIKAFNVLLRASKFLAWS